MVSATANKLYNHITGKEMLSSIHSAMSGLKSFTTRIRANANNIANSNTAGYKKTRVLLENTRPDGVKAVVEKTTYSNTLRPEETKNSQVPAEQSNVDLTQEIPDMMLNANHFKANLESLKTADEMMQSVLNLKA